MSAVGRYEPTPKYIREKTNAEASPPATALINVTAGLGA